jgi:hypothetical protein
MDYFNEFKDGMKFGCLIVIAISLWTIMLILWDIKELLDK